MYNLDDALDNRANLLGLQQQVAGNAAANLLRSIKVKIISNCNLRCEMCRYWQIAKQRLDDETVFSLLQHSVQLGCKKVHFSGGEATLHPSLNEYIRFAADLGLRVNLTSNGTTMTKRRAKEWINAGLRAASFSLDGTDSKTHDKIRGVKGAFKKTFSAITTLQREIQRNKTKLKIRVNTVVSQQNFEQLPELIELGGQLGVIDIVPMPVDGKNVIRPTVAEIQHYNQEIAPRCLAIRKKYGMPINAGRIFPFGLTTPNLEMSTLGRYAHGYYKAKPCYAPWLHCFVSHDGEVYACCMTRGRMGSLGNVKTQTLTKIFQGEKYEQFRSLMLRERLPICAHCDQYTKENKLVDQRLVSLAPITGTGKKSLQQQKPASSNNIPHPLPLVQLTDTLK